MNDHQHMQIFHKQHNHQHNHEITMHIREIKTEFMRNRNVDAVIILKSSAHTHTHNGVFSSSSLFAIMEYLCTSAGLCVAHLIWLNNFMWRGFRLHFCWRCVCAFVCPFFLCSPNVYCLKQSEKNSFQIVHCLCVLFAWMNAPKKICVCVCVYLWLLPSR